jgi:hypothetical protein
MPGNLRAIGLGKGGSRMRSSPQVDHNRFTARDQAVSTGPVAASRMGSEVGASNRDRTFRAAKFFG